MSSIIEKVDALPQLDIDADGSCCLNVSYHGFKARIVISVREMEVQLLSGKSRVKLMFTNSNPIDDRFELCEVEV